MNQILINIINVNIIRIECNVTADAATTSVCTQYTSCHWAYRQDIRYQKDLRTSFIFRSSYGTLRIWRFALWIKMIARFSQSEKVIKWHDNDIVSCLFWTSRRNRLETYFLLERRQQSKTFDSIEKNLLPLNYNHWALSYEMADILNIGGEQIFNDRIVKFEFHMYNRYVNTTSEYSEIKISIQQQDLYTLPFSTSKVDFKERKCTKPAKLWM